MTTENTIEDTKETIKAKNVNLLEKEKSPYLLQHRYNPVYWRPWGNEAFELAKKEQKPIFLSIGYSTCYWCHVMEKECFEDNEVASVLNKDFICIKLDREERPDIDAIYMDFIQGISGRGGWPMTVFLSDSGEPFYGGTYFPKAEFLKMLAGIQKVWKDEKEALLVNGAKFKEFLASQKLPKEETPAISSKSKEQIVSLLDPTLNQAFLELEGQYDPHFGGFSKEPKFPSSLRLELLLRVNRKLEDKTSSTAKQSLSMVSYTLDKMASGGFYDQLEGGFHRYSVDNKWHLPHFEKMLYDNAMLSKTYAEAFLFTKEEKYKSICLETLNYLEARMTNSEGAFFSAEDAGEVGKEGEFYLWRFSELESALNDIELKKLTNIFTVEPGGNFEPEAGPVEGLNVISLNLASSLEDSRDSSVLKIKDKLKKIRDERDRPFIDDKTLTAWNGLAIESFSVAGRIFEEKKYIDAAEKAVSFIKSNLLKDGKLIRRYRDKEAKGDAFLNDYAFLIQGLISLFEATQDFKYLDFAKELQKTQDDIFWDEEDKAYFFAGPDDKTLIARTKEFADSSIPSGNGISALNNLRLAKLCCEDDYKTRAEEMLFSIYPLLKHSPSHFSSYLIAYDFWLREQESKC